MDARSWMRRSRIGAMAGAALGLIALATVLALAVLWPRGHEVVTPFSTSVATERATVVDVVVGACTFNPRSDCRRVQATLDTGPEKGSAISMDMEGGFDIDPGDAIRVVETRAPDGATAGTTPVDRYAFSDFERRGSLVWLGAVFAVLVVLAARWRGLRALAGLAASLAISVFFIVPAILEGTTPILVALVGSLAILLVTLPVAHGVGPTAVAAALATAAALIATLALAELATGLAHITGFGSEEASYIRAAGQDVSVRGMLIAGIVIAALGVLDDLTISQASTVMALHRVSPGHPPRALFVEAMRVGRDHIVAVINTLVLAYVGASLPVLLVFSIADVSFGDAVNSEVVAAEIVATLVGSIGLMAAAPLATGIAAWLAPSVPPGTSEPDHHAH
ncbi:MAG: YibE/F family protein [Thermoleophilia bacterium]